MHSPFRDAHPAVEEGRLRVWRVAPGGRLGVPHLPCDGHPFQRLSLYNSSLSLFRSSRAGILAVRCSRACAGRSPGRRVRRQRAAQSHTKTDHQRHARRTTTSRGHTELVAAARARIVRARAGRRAHSHTHPREERVPRLPGTGRRRPPACPPPRPPRARAHSSPPSNSVLLAVFLASSISLNTAFSASRPTSSASSVSADSASTGGKAASVNGCPAFSTP